MNWLKREGTGHYLNEARLCGTGALLGAVPTAFLRALLASWRGEKLFVDPAFQAESERNILTQLLPRPKAESVADGSLDFVYLGAGLDLAHCLEAWSAKLRLGGLLAGSDYTGAIKEAVDAFARNQGIAAAFTSADPEIADWFLRIPHADANANQRVTFLTAYDSSYASVGELSRPNKEEYCRRHGYRFVCRSDGFETDRPASWSKLRFAREELDCSDWVFWNDADSLVMDMSVPLSWFCSDSHEMIISGDPYNGINFGCWLARNSDWSNQFLERLYGMTEFLDHPWWETAAILSLYARDADVRRHIAVVPNKLFNAFPLPGGGYEPGDFIAHFAGMPRPERENTMRQFLTLVR